MISGSLFAPNAVVHQACNVIQELLSGGNPERSSGSAPTASEASKQTDAEDLFKTHFRYVDKLVEKDGPAGLQALAEKLSKIKIFSLFSGLGGAELAAQQMYVAVAKKCNELGLPSPKMPENLLSCDYDTMCQRVLQGHAHPSTHIISDMMRFISSKCDLT